MPSDAVNTATSAATPSAPPISRIVALTELAVPWSSGAMSKSTAVALGVAALVAVFTASDGTLTPDGYVAGLQPAALVAAGVVALGALLVLVWMPRETGRQLL